VHIHVPKTAGTAVRVWLYRAFPEGYGSWYPDYVFDETTLAAAGLRDLRIRAFSTHWIRRFPSTICGRNMKYFTLLRHPLDHVISRVRYYYQMQVDAQKTPAAALGPLRDFAAGWVDDWGNDPFHENMQTNFFALHPWSDLQASKFNCEPDTYRSWPSPVREAYMRERLEVAKDVLRSFLAVGVTEHIIDSLEVLRDRSQRHGFELLPSQELTFENITRIRLEDDSWLGHHDPVGRRILASVTEDEELYYFARALLEHARQAKSRHRRPILRVV